MAGTYQIVKLWSGDLFKISIYFDSVPVAYPFRGSLSNVYDEDELHQLESSWNSFLYDTCILECVVTMSGSGETIGNVEKAFESCGSDLHVYLRKNPGQLYLAPTMKSELYIIPRWSTAHIDTRHHQSIFV